MLPTLSLTRMIAETRRPLADLAADFRFAFALSSRLQNIANEKSAAFIARLDGDPNFRSAAFALVRRRGQDGSN